MPISRRLRAARRALSAALAAACTLALAQATGPAAAHQPVHTAAAATSKAPLTLAQAEARATATGQPVIADALTTETTQTMANADGTVTLTENVQPVRVWQNGAWVSLDATLHQNADGTLSPDATPSALILSGGGTGPLAVLTLGGRQLSITLPVSLPTPVAAGATATYPNVLPDTDLVVTATDQGGYSDVIVVKSAAAASNPQLSTLLKATTSQLGNLTVAADASGNISATDPSGHPVFTAPAPAMWDSATATAAGTASQTASAAHATTGGIAPAVASPVSSPSPNATPSPTASAAGTDPASGMPLASSTSGPGEYAHTAAIGTTYSGNTLTLKPSSTLLNGTSTKYPVYLDPSVAPSLASWTMVNSYYPGQSYFNSGTGGEMQVGFDGWQAPYFTARSFVTLGMPSTVSGAKIKSASVTFDENVAPSCTAEEVDLYTTGPIYPGPTPAATTWSNQPSWNSEITPAQSVAYGYSGCPEHGVEWDITNQVSTLVSGGGQQLTLGLKTPSSAEGTSSSGYNSGGNDLYWKQFVGKNTVASITYNHPPTAPTVATSPGTNCQSQTLGDTGVNLLANPSDQDGGSLTTTFDLWNTADSTQKNLLTPTNGVASNQVSGSSGQQSVLTLPESFYKNLVGNTKATFEFKAQSTDVDGPDTGPWSSNPCTFTWDPSRPGAPGVATNPSPTAPNQSCLTVGGSVGSTQPLGTSCSFNLTPPNNTSISGYLYQVNQQPPVTVTATGAATINVPLTQLVNTLTVYALSPGGNAGTATPVTFDGTALNPPAKDGDLDNNGTPDLIIPGAVGSAYPPGLWLATGHSDGTVDQDAINIGTLGLNYATTPTPADWNGAQALTGNFCGNGAQDAMAYFPTGDNAGGGSIVCNDASTDPLHPINPLASQDNPGFPYVVTKATFADTSGVMANQIANAGHVSGKASTHPDLLATIGSYLYLFYSSTPNGYSNDHGFGCSQACDELGGTATPESSFPDWDSWIIATTQLTSGTAMFLWNPADGNLYLWTNLALSTGSTFPNATTLTYQQQYELASGWNTGKTLSLRAADINGDGLPDLWATDSSGHTTAYMPTALQNNATFNTASTTLTTANHAWLFQDIGANASGTKIASSADIAGSLTLTGSDNGTGGALWNTGDLFSPDALLNTNPDMTPNISGTGQLYTGAPAITIDANHDFTIDARVRPYALGGTVLSQDGATTPGFTLTADKTSGDWQFCMAQSDTTGAPRDCATGPAVQLGLWTLLTATYNHQTGIMTLYVNGADTAMASHKAPTTFGNNAFRIGAQAAGTTSSGFYAGQVAEIHTWNQVAAPAQPQSAGSVFVPATPTRIMDTRHGTGGTTGPIAANATVPLQVTGTGGAISATGVTAVALTITDTAATSTGHLTVYPDGTAQPTTSAVNFPTGATVANGVIVPVGSDGKIDILNSINTGTGSSQIIADLTGYFTTNTAASGASTYSATQSTSTSNPVRILDTRTGGSPISANTALAVTVAGAHTIPAGISAVAVNLTAINEATGGYLTAYADGTSTPTTTTVSFTAGQAIGTMSIIPVNTTDGKIDVYNASGGSTDVIADVVGYFTPGVTGQRYHPLDATRLFDTRLNNNPLKTNEARPVPQSVISAVNPTLVINLTATQETGGGNLSVLPGNLSYTTPGTTSLIYDTSSIANLDLAATTSNYLSVLNYSSATTQLIIDTNGYFASY